MTIQLPHTIESKYGEKLTFLRQEGQRLIVEAVVSPGAGPVMHTHLFQDESLTVMQGKLAYQLVGQNPVYVGVGQTALFPRGVPHRFWNAGEEDLHLTGWVDPADNIVFFLSSLYDAMNAGQNHRPALFDSAYLMYRYRSEYDLPEMPGFVKRVIVPLTYAVGKMLGKYRKFGEAPAPRREE